MEEAVSEYRTIKLLLQPFIENAVNHAIRDDDQPLNVCIRIFENEDSVIFEIEDDGVGIQKDVLNSIQSGQSATGYGISNVDSRIKLAYGDEYGVSIFSFLNQGTKIVIRIPVDRR